MTIVAVLEVQDCMASSAAITHDVMTTANRISAAAKRALPFHVNTVRCGPRRNGAELRSAELIIIPGLGAASADELDEKLRSLACRRASEMLVEALESGATLAASCASTFLLGEAGLLDGRRATTTWWLAPAFRRRYPKVDLVTDQMVVSDWPIATAGAAMAQMDLMLAVIAKFASPRLSQLCARYLLLDQRRSQAPYMALAFLAGQDEKIARAEAWVRKNIDRDFSMDEIAATVGLTPRTFARRLASVCGLSPVRFAQRIRIEAAELLLETTRLSVDEVARRVGYAEPSTLRRLIRRESRRSPAELRRGV